MCFHYAMSKDAQTLENRYKAQFKAAKTPLEKQYHASAFLYPAMPVVSTEAPETIQMFQWGLIPSWTKSKADADRIRSMTHNAKAETVFELPSFRNAIKRSRCLVAAEGFYEWRDFQKKKYPYFIWMKEVEVFSFAGISEQWIDKESGEIVNSFSILTTEANDLMAQIHNFKLRMPVILSPENEREWIVPSTSKERIQELAKGLASDRMGAYTIDKLISSNQFNSNVPEVQEEFVYAELPEISYSI
ncbi:MAG: SOS response-associated peptidase [Bacteroidota bacterium]